MRIGPATAAALLVLFAGCARCSRGGGPAPERFLPADTSLAVVIPNLRAAQEQLAPMSRTVLSFPAAADLAQTLAALKDQLGFDPLDRKGLESAGLDVTRGAAIAIAPQPPLIVLPVGDASRLQALVARLARDRLGAVRRDTTDVGGRAVTTYRAREGAPPALSMVITENTAILAPGADGPSRIASAVARPSAEALSGSASFTQARAALGETPAILAFAPAGSPQFAHVSLLRDGAAVGLSASSTRLALRGVLLLPPERLEYWRNTAAPAAASDPNRTAALPRDAFLVARFEGDAATVARRILPVASVVEPLRRAGLDLEHDLLDVLAPGAAAALSVAPTFQVAAVSRASELSTGDPFRLVHLAAVLRVKDRDRAAAALERLARAAPRLGLTAARQGTNEMPRWRLARGEAALDLAIDGQRLLVGGGRGRLDALVARAQPTYVAPTDASRAALTGGVAGAVLDFGQLVASFRSLPAEAYGSGPDAFVMRSLAERVIDPASRLLAVSVRVELAHDAALIDLVLEARAPEGLAR